MEMLLKTFNILKNQLIKCSSNQISTKIFRTLSLEIGTKLIFWLQECLILVKTFEIFMNFVVRIIVSNQIQKNYSDKTIYYVVKD